jgi:hypothetical protein
MNETFISLHSFWSTYKYGDRIVTTHTPFHEQLRYERELRCWSQADLAEKVGCDTKQWAAGKVVIGFRVHIIARHLANSLEKMPKSWD